MIHIDSISGFLALLETNADKISEVGLSETLTTLTIEVDGDGYGNGIPGEQLLTLWEIPFPCIRRKSQRTRTRR